MRKILSSLMILTLIGLFSTTYLSSSKTEERFKTQINQVNHSSAGFLQVELIDYQRGLLVSEVKTRITQRGKALPLQHQIRHFPWKVSMQTSIVEESALALELAERLPLKQLHLLTDINLDGSSKSQFTLPEATFSDDKRDLQLQGLQFTFSLDGQLSDGQMSLQLDRLKLSETGDAEFTLADVEMRGQFTDLLGIPLGDGKFRIGTFALKQQQKTDFELNDLRFKAVNTRDREQLTSGIDLQLTALQLGGETFTDGRMQLKVSGIDATAVRELQASALQLQVELRGKQVDPFILQLQMLELYVRLFQAGLEVTLDRLSLQSDGGTLCGQGMVTAQGFNLAGSNPLPFDKFDSQVKLDMDQALFNAAFRSFDNLQRADQTNNPAVQNEQAEQLAGGLLQKGIFFRQDDGGYRLELSIKQGQTVLNGKLIQL